MNLGACLVTNDSTDILSELYCNLTFLENQEFARDLYSKLQMPEVPTEFQTRIYQVFSVYEKARFAALTKITLSLIAWSALFLISLKTTEIIAYRALVIGAFLISSGALIKSKHKNIQSSRIYKHRVNSYLALYSLEFNGKIIVVLK